MKRGLFMLYLGTLGCGPAVSLGGPDTDTAGSSGAPGVPIESSSSGPAAPASTTGPLDTLGDSGGSTSAETTAHGSGSSSSSGLSSSTGEPALPGTYSILFDEEIFGLEAGPEGLYIVSTNPNAPDSDDARIRRLDDEGTPDPSFGNDGWVPPGPWDVDRDTGDLVVVSDALRRYDPDGGLRWDAGPDTANLGPVVASGDRVFAMAEVGQFAQVLAFDASTGALDPLFAAPDVVGPLGSSPTTAKLVAVSDRLYAGMTPDDIASQILFRFSELDRTTGDVLLSGVTSAVSTHVAALFVSGGVPHWVGTVPPHVDPSWSPLFEDDPTTHEPMHIISSVTVTDEAVFFGGWTNSKDWRVERRDPITLALDPAFGEGGVIGHVDWPDTRVLDLDVYGDWLYFVYRSLEPDHKGWVVERRQQSDGSH